MILANKASICYHEPMSTIPSFFTTLFCAFVLLVQQQANASEGYDRYSEIFTKAMEAAASAIAVAA